MADNSKIDPSNQPEPGRESQLEGGVPPAQDPLPPEQKKSFFGYGHKSLKPPRSERDETPMAPPPLKMKKKKPIKPPKGTKKPFFSFGKKKMPPEPSLTASPAPTSVATQPEVVAASAPPQQEQPRRGLFGHKEKPAKPPREKKVKQTKPPREKKVKEPRAAKAKKVKKTRPPREPREKKPLFGKKGAKGSKMKAPKVPKPLKPSRKKQRGGRGRPSVVGLDLGRTSISAVQLKYQSGGVAMLSAAVDQLPEGLIQEGEVQDVDALAVAIKDFWKSYNLKGKKVSLGLANQKVVVRTLDFPILEESELRIAIEFQAQDYIPIPIEEAVFDYHVLGQTTDVDGVVKQKVLVVAAQKVMVMDYINALKKAKLGVGEIDLQAFAMLRSLAPRSSFELGPTVGAVAIANIGSDVTNIVVETGGEPQFTRIVSFGGDNFTRAIQDFKGMTFAEADTIKAEFGLPLPGERLEGGEAMAPAPQDSQGSPYDMPMETESARPPAPGPDAGPPSEPTFDGVPFDSNAGKSLDSAGEPPEPQIHHEPEVAPSPELSDDEGTKAEIQRVLDLTADSLADEIRRSLDYYQSQEMAAPITQLILSGGGALLANLDKHMSQIFPFEVVVGNPMQNITQNRTSITDEALQVMSPRLAIAIGLALEDED